jgi:O-antigen/teichoic acid export membrane protein
MRRRPWPAPRAGRRRGDPEEPLDADDGVDDANRSDPDHVRGSALLVLGRILAVLLGMATQVIIVRALTKAEFGAFAYALVLANSARVLLSLGQGKLLSRFMAMYDEQRDYPRMFGAMFLAVGTILATSLLLVGALLLFPDVLVEPAIDSRVAVTLVLILVFLSPLEALDLVFVSLFAVFAKPRAIFFRKHLMAPGLRLVVVVLLVLVDASVRFLAIGYVLAALAGVLLYLTLLVKVLKDRGLLHELHPRQIVFPFRAVFQFSFPLITGELALLSTTLGGVLVLGLYHSTVEVANYRSVFSSARLNTAITASFATLFLPTIARLYERADIDRLRGTYWHTATFVAVLTFPVFALTGPLAPATTVTLFGDRYAASSAVLAVLALGYYFNVLLGFNAYTLQVCGRIRYLVGVNFFVAALNVGLCFLLAPQYAAVGVAVANSCALVAQNALNQWALRGSIRSEFIDRECRTSYAAILVGAGVLWLFSVLASPGMVLSVVAAAVVSLAVLAVSRRALRLADTFPELRRVPIVRRVVS